MWTTSKANLWQKEIFKNIWSFLKGCKLQTQQSRKEIVELQAAISGGNVPAEQFIRITQRLQEQNSEVTKLVAEYSRLEQKIRSIQTIGPAQPRDPRTGKYITRERAAFDEAEKQKNPFTEIRTNKALGQQVDERRLNLATLGVPLTTEEILSRGRQTANRILNEVRTRNESNIRNVQPVRPSEYAEGDPSKFKQLTGRITKEYDPSIAGIAKEIEREYRIQLGTAKKTTAADEKAAIDAEKLASLRTRIASDPRYAQAIGLARQQGLGIQNLQKVEDRGGDVQSLLFRKNDDGTDLNYKTFVNTITGRATPGARGQYRSFTQGIVKDIGELTKWSIALAAIYGPLNKLQQLVGDMVENQSKLADAVIAVNTSMLDQSQIFDISAQAAAASGEAVTGVIDAFTQAYRAAGRYTDQAQRQSQAIKLLNDSLVLSKISSLDQAGAIDTLTACSVTEWERTG